MRRILRQVSICFFLSGATGLVYEVLWIRMLGLIFGHTVFAVTTVLTAFMAGLALGSYLFGKLADRSRNPLLLYGLLEGGIGLYCLAIPTLIALAERLYLTLYQGLHLSYYAFSLTQFLLVFLILLVPTSLMGGTLPVLSRLFVGDQATLGRRVGFLYALNTFGAVIGVAGAGYVLLPSAGMRGTLFLTAIANLGIAALIMHWSRFVPLTVSHSPAAREGITPGDTGAGRRGILAPLAIFGLGLSGAAAMIYEVAWSRALALIIGSSTYAFTAMLVSFLVGIALGSALFARLSRTGPIQPFVFGALQTGIGLAALVMLPVFGTMPEFFLQVFRLSTAAGFIQTAQFLTSFASMILPTLLIGATFPCVVQIAVQGLGRVGSDVGRIYAVNTLGAVLGTFIAGFLLIPSIGAHATVKLAIFLNLGIGLVFTLGSAKVAPVRTWLPWTALAVAALGGVYGMPAWDRVAMSSGVAIYGPSLTRMPGKVDLGQAFPDTRLLFYEDGISATVTIHQGKGTTYLRVNGKTDASTGGDMPTQLMLGHLPLLLHPDPKSVLIIGLGSGMTAGAVARHPVERIDVIEIEPAVVRANRFFAQENRHVLSDPRLRMIIADARNFLLSTAERYDVIVSEPSNPWIGGVATLFSREFFALARQKLQPGGMMLQWVHGYSLAPGDLQMVVKTFRSAFPATTVWNTTPGDYLLVGRAAPVPLDLDRLQRQVAAVPGLQEDLRRVGLRSAQAVLSDFLLGEEDAARYSAAATLNTDDLLRLEFSAPLSLYLDTVQLNTRVLQGYQTKEFPVLAQAEPSQFDQPEVRFDLGMGYLAKGLPQQAIGQFEKALAAQPRHMPALLELGKAQLQINLPLKAVATFEVILAQDPQHPEATYQLGVAYQAQQMPDRALEYLSKAVALSPENPAYRTRLATLLGELGRSDEAIAQYQAARALQPQDAALLEGMGTAYLQQGQSELAIQTFKEAMAVDAMGPNRHAHQLGRTYLRVSRFGEAVETLRLATQYAPLSVEALVDLSTAYTGQGQLDQAAQILSKAMALDPFHPAIQRLRTLPAAADSR